MFDCFFFDCVLDDSCTDATFMIEDDSLEGFLSSHKHLLYKQLNKLEYERCQRFNEGMLESSELENFDWIQPFPLYSLQDNMTLKNLSSEYIASLKKHNANLQSIVCFFLSKNYLCGATMCSSTMC